MSRSSSTAASKRRSSTRTASSSLAHGRADVQPQARDERAADDRRGRKGGAQQSVRRHRLQLRQSRHGRPQRRFQRHGKRPSKRWTGASGAFSRRCRPRAASCSSPPITATPSRCSTIKTGQPHTAHTTQPGAASSTSAARRPLAATGALADIAPTMLSLLDLPVPPGDERQPLVELHGKPPSFVSFPRAARKTAASGVFLPISVPRCCPHGSRGRRPGFSGSEQLRAAFSKLRSREPQRSPRPARCRARRAARSPSGTSANPLRAQRPCLDGRLRPIHLAHAQLRGQAQRRSRALTASNRCARAPDARSLCRKTNGSPLKKTAA